MAAIVVYDPLDPVVANRVTLYRRSAHTPNFDSEPNKLVNPNLSALVGIVPRRHWKYDGVSAIIEMLQAEKDALAPGSPLHQEWESNAPQSTVLAWQTAIMRTAQEVAAGLYEVKWTYALRLVAAGPVNSKAQARFLLDGSPSGINVHVDTEWQRFSGFDFFQFSNKDTPVLRVEFQRDPVTGGNDTVEIRRVKISLQQIGL